MIASEDGKRGWDYPDLSAITFSGEHCFTVDVEEWFQVGAFETSFNREEWLSLESRVRLQTENLLDLLNELSVKGTFFCLGWVAERYPELIKEISSYGHEIGCHGSDHRRIFTMDRGAFEQDIKSSKKKLEEASGQEVIGYRAPSFSLTAETWWAYECLEEVGFKYSSSLYPVTTDHYGMADAPRTAFYPIGSSFVEIPMTVCDLPFKRVPASGGGYFRLLPFALSRFLFNRGVLQSGVPGIFYMHPWEMDPNQPFVSHAPWLSKFRHYTGQRHLPAKLMRLVADHRWNSLSAVYKELINSPEAGN